jgi:hypothetical protein
MSSGGSEAPAQIQDEFTMDIFLLLQNDPFHDQGDCTVIGSPLEDGLMYVFGAHCIVQYAVDPIERLVKVTRLDWV